MSILVGSCGGAVDVVADFAVVVEAVTFVVTHSHPTMLYCMYVHAV